MKEDANPPGMWIGLLSYTTFRISLLSYTTLRVVGEKDRLDLLATELFRSRLFFLDFFEDFFEDFLDLLFSHFFPLHFLSDFLIFISNANIKKKMYSCDILFCKKVTCDQNRRVIKGEMEDAMPSRRKKEETSSTFVKLSDLSYASGSLDHVHHKGNSFVITSSHPLDSLASCDVASNEHLFGSLACYFYPSDAVIEFTNFVGDPKAAIQEMKKNWKERCEEDPFHGNVYHISVSSVNPETDEVYKNEGGKEDEEEEDYEDVSHSEEEEEMDEEEKEALWASDDEAPDTEAKI